jgi:hypothetical protein
MKRNHSALAQPLWSFRRKLSSPASTGLSAVKPKSVGLGLIRRAKYG